MSRNTGPSAKVRAQVAYRDRGHCLRCHAWAQDLQHRQARGAGGTSRPEVNGVANLVSMCRPCHDWAERQQRSEAYDQGWAIRHGSRELPSEVPLTDIYGNTFFLSDEGEIVPLHSSTLLPNF